MSDVTLATLTCFKDFRVRRRMLWNLLRCRSFGKLYKKTLETRVIERRLHNLRKHIMKHLENYHSAQIALNLYLCRNKSVNEIDR